MPVLEIYNYVQRIRNLFPACLEVIIIIKKNYQFMTNNFDKIKEYDNYRVYCACLVT